MLDVNLVSGRGSAVRCISRDPSLGPQLEIAGSPGDYNCIFGSYGKFIGRTVFVVGTAIFITGGRGRTHKTSRLEPVK